MEDPGEAKDAGSAQQTVKAGDGLPGLLWVGIGLIVYLLTLGPAVKVHHAVPKSRPIIEGIYFWVEPLARRSPACKAVIEWYVYKLWRAKS